MKLSKETEVEIREIYQTYWDAYLSGDFETFASFLDEAIVIYGTAVGEIFYTKEEALNFYIATAEEMTGKADFRNRLISIKAVGDTIVIYDQSQLYILIDSTWTYYGSARITGIMELKSSGWKLVHQHGSFPDSRTEEGQQVASEKIKEENLQLREAVQRRTVELESKTRELSIEASLERVRSRSLAMQKSDELVDASNVLFSELQKLGIETIRTGVGTVDSKKETVVVWSSQLVENNEIKILGEVPKGAHAFFEGYYAAWQNKKPWFTYTMTGKEIVEYYTSMSSILSYPEKTEFNPSETFSVFFFPEGSLNVITQQPLIEEECKLLQRFANAFGQIYRRFLDLKLAEAQSREARIEASLERVRSVAMGMHKPDDMLKVCQVISEQLQLLSVSDIRNVQTAIIDENGKGTYMNYQYFTQYGKGIIEEVVVANHPAVADMIQHMANSPDAFFSHSFTGSELEKWKKYRRDENQLPDPILEDSSQVHFYFYSIGQGGLGLSTYTPLSDDHIAFFHRFRNVFALAYQRFRDIEQAEGQAREAQIEAALERVRSRTMAMQKSEELSETAQVLFNQFIALGEKPIQITIGIIHEEEKVIEFNVTDWAGGGSKVSQSFMVSIGEPTLVNKLYEAWKKKEKSLVIDLSGQELEDWLTYRKAISGIEVKSGDTHGRRVITSAFFSRGHVSFSSPEPRPAESVKLLERFASVFDLTYTRFLDLQQAEAQTREAQIELALERVRARTMAMQKSEELQDVIQVVYDQFIQLNVRIEHAGFIMDYKTRDDMYIWLADNFKSPFHITIPYFDSPHWNSFLKAKERGDDFFSNQLNFEEKNKFYTDLFNLIPGLPEESQQAIFAKPGLSISTVLLENVGLYIEHMDGTPYTNEENVTLMRFGTVFQQTYTRFLDLQKAEAQAKESEIQLAMERVRARTMAMQHSDELADASSLLDMQVRTLGIDTWGCAFHIYANDAEGDYEWFSSANGSLPFYKTPREHFFLDFYKKGSSGEIFHAQEFAGEDCKAHYDYLKTIPVVGDSLKSLEQSGISLPTYQIDHIAFFKYGYILFITYKPVPEAHDVFQRFAKVFEQTYIRFLDLQKSESQTQKVKVEVALERVRARALAMQEPEELIEVAQVMRHEMGLLGIEELETSSIYIHDEGSDIADCWYAIKDIRVPEKKLVSDHIRMELHKTYVGREMLEFYNSSQQQASIVMQGAHRIEWIKYCSGISEVLEDFYGEVIPDRTYHLYKFSNGAIGAAAEGDISDESWELLRRATSVFSLAYSRFKDLTQARIDLLKLKTEKQRAEDALLHLKAAQAQLIQSEKMASLGELTAGIAHEIQNPLNFVNNFSDVNKELLVELQDEIDKENLDEVKAIAKDIIANEDKINHHGKRADAIVKGMLMHSRTSGGVKEPTDINALADEYLRLAYHGLRAKDKSFNATMKTNFDDSIGMINVIPQDIGRVILNLITNAFYAVSTFAPKSPKGDLLYAPTVTVRTKLIKSPSGDLGANRVTIFISDNGPGIPSSAIDKIFQPFFTTKPSGQGTGLGLSLSYDIVKAHGGELKVETKEGEGSVFTIQLPVS